ncbi:DNA repair protein complementing XP-C cells homolog isoform X1 [Culex pipiens pallens]|uniref:DNA repair protein complementing XP-C cells homolog isoform X1 n=1 Tax=Culex pipiens pallens TaxID=42434 RepID=UPI001953AB81|nr:DNA repair protein complementing XP-C cells homolog isoform X1 [Culex pipiens pallens]
MASDSEPESPPEFSASEDEWNPDQEEKKITGFKAAAAPVKQKKQQVKKLPTRSSRRIATKLGKELPKEEIVEAVPELPPEEDDAVSTDGEEVVSTRRKQPVAKGRRGRKPKQVAVKVAKEDSIKLTTFTVEELYRKYRPDLAEPAKQEKVKVVRRKVREEDDRDDDDESSGDDYLVDPDELDLNSEFFNSVTTKEDGKGRGEVKFDCNAGVSVAESEEDDEEDKPLSSVKNAEVDSTEFNKKLIQQINQSSQDCMTMVKLVEVSKRIEREREEMDLLRRKREQKEVKKGEEDVSNLLLAGEKVKGKVVKHSGRSDFVAVDGGKKDKDREKTVEITLKFESAEQNGRSGKKKMDLLTAIKRMMNREKRQNQIYLHKVSVLCWIGHGTFLNRTLSNANLIKAINKRLLPSTTNCRPKGLTNLHYFEQVTRYFRKAVRLKNHVMYFHPPTSAKLPPLSATLKYQILQRSAFSKRDYILLYLLMLRSLSIHCRLVISLPVPPKHVPTSDLYRMNPQTREELEADRRLLLDFRRAHLAPKGSTIHKVKTQLTAMVDKTVEARRKEAARKRRREGFCATIPQLDGGHDHLPEPKPRKQLKLMESSFLEIEQNIARKLQGKTKPAKKPSTDQIPFPDELDEQVRARREKILAAYKASKEQKAAVAAAKAAQEEYCGEGSSSSSSARKGRRPGKRNVTRSGIDLWVEVYCEHEDKWVTVDVIAGMVHCLEHTVNQASHPISYVLAWNNDGSIKDVSPRYISRLGTKKSKLRVEDSWLEQALVGRNGRRRHPSRRDRTEDLKFDKLLNKRPFPEQIAEFKNHPRFAIQRHLLKNEAIYPRDAVVLGHFKGEPIYPRDCVHLLFSREGWLRQAKTVRMFEEPYKVVTRKAKYDRVTGTTVTGLNTELFGEWQVQDYEPPTAQNGQVPRSAYGNVELFKACMLPKGTVHLQLPGLNKICKRLRVDCAPAITGFEYRNNACAAVYDGYVVCEEFRDVVLDEWYQEQVEEQRKQEEKRLKRIYGNWKRLVAGLFIRKKLKDRYNFDNM